LSLGACKNGGRALPASYYSFPIDTTIQIIQSLPSAVKESSGIIFWKDHIWTHNDSGDDPNLYELSIETGEIFRTVTLENAKARDWEDIAIDSQYIFIADLGNNGGKRQDLAIYRVNQAEVLATEKSVQAFKIKVKYPDRTDFKPPAYKHNFDCEAILADKDSIYLFSKNHLDKHCRLYSLAKDLPEQTAILKDRFDTKGMVTGASTDAKNGVLALVGYNLNPDIGYFGPFVWLFWEYPGNQFFRGKSKRINLPFISQAEAITYWKDGQFIIGTEQTALMGGKLMVFDAKKWIDDYQAN